METAKLKQCTKVVCIICMVVYALFAVLGVLIFTNTIPPEAYSVALGVTELTQGPNAAMYITIIGIVVTISYCIRFLFTIPVLYGIKNPSKMMLGIVLYGILTVAIAANLIGTFTQGGEAGFAMGQFVATAYIFAAAIAIRRATK